MSAATLFNKALRYRNFVTPEVVEYGYSGKYCYELSTGCSLFELGGNVYGVTVVDRRTLEHINELSKLFNTLDEAYSYVKELELY